MQSATLRVNGEVYQLNAELDPSQSLAAFLRSKAGDKVGGVWGDMWVLQCSLLQLEPLD